MVRVVGTFLQRIEELKRMIGAPGDLTGTCVVDQRYAHYQLLGTKTSLCTTQGAATQSTSSSPCSATTGTT